MLTSSLYNTLFHVDSYLLSEKTSWDRNDNCTELGHDVNANALSYYTVLYTISRSTYKSGADVRFDAWNLQFI